MYVLYYDPHLFKLLLTENQGEDPATCAVRQSFTLPTIEATSTPAAVASSSPYATTNVSSVATSATVTSSTSAIKFTGAAMKKDSAAGAILGVLGLMAAL